MATPEPLQPYREIQAIAEQDVRGILESTAQAIQRRVRTLRPGIGGEVRAAQLRLTLAAVRKLQRQMWTGRVDPRLKALVEAAEQAGESAVEAMSRAAYAGLPEAVADTLIRALKASAASGLASDRARKRRALSRMVYRQAAFHGDKLEQVIRQGIISNLSARELAKDAYDYVSPTAKGGASYAAMRLARTEINNALHERQIAGAKRPGVKAVVWNLSGSHKVPDECNVYAAHGGNGHWAPDNIPEKPHPQCFCYLTYVTQSPQAFIRKLEDGGFDDEIDRRTRENMARLGQPVGGITPDNVPKPKKRTTPAKPKRVVPDIRDAPPPTIFDPPPLVAPPVNLPQPRKVRVPAPIPEKLPGGRVEVPAGPLPEAVRKLSYKIHDNVKKGIKERFLRVAHIQHGHVGDVINSSIAEFRMGREDGSLRGDTTANFVFGSRSLALHSGIERNQKPLVQAHSCGWHPKGGDDVIETTIAHEMGHSLISYHRMTVGMCEDVMDRMVEIYGLDPRPKTTINSQRIVVTEMMDWFGQPNNAAKIKAGVSTYAAKSINEFFAEVWSDYTMNPSPPETTVRMAEVIKPYMSYEKKGLLGA